MDDAIIKLSLSEEDVQDGAGFLKQFSVSETYQIHTHTFYEIFFVNKGKALHNVNGQSQLLTEGSFVLIRPNDIHFYDFFNQYDFEFINIGFEIELFHECCQLLRCPADRFDKTFLPPQIEVEGYYYTDIKRKLLQIPEIEKGMQRNQYVRSILPYFLYQFLSNSITVKKRENIPDWLTRLLFQMNEPANYIEGLPKLIELSNLSQEYLTRVFRKYLDITPTAFINAKRMNLSADLLLEEGHEVIDICYECGFHNLSHFYHNFKKQYGCSPKQFLENYNARMK